MHFRRNIIGKRALATVLALIQSNDANGLRRWLDAGNDPDLADPQRGALLNVAAGFGHLGLVELLLESGANPESLDADGDSPLMLAVGSGHTAVARLLLQAGAPLSYEFHRRDSANERARLSRMQDEFRSLIDLKTAQAQLRAGVESAPAEMRDSIQKLQSEISQDLGTDWFEPVEKHAVDACESFETLKMLVCEFDADINRINACGEWPLLRFAQNNDLAAITWAIEQGADVDQTSTGETALFSAVQVDNLGMIKLLLDAGADVNQRDCDLCVPLHCSQSIAATHLLLDRGADPTLKDQADFPCWQFVRRPEVRKHLAAAAVGWTKPVSDSQ